MKTTMLAMLKLLGTLLAFVGILAGCIVGLLLVIAMVRFPPLLIAVLLACWIFNRLQRNTS
ncbi:hypothetical protein [Pseudomonas veronii]|uniref:Lipoprotein n=1 Tax=Pseudomonas veronii TaxID=76761 RepID=A0A6G8ITA8_PSEVE|nr:hypothetical protein [Pseudomonas veronii]QIM56518.1 hypothetical protein E4167_35690 [Pseudomonas veronii]